MALRPWTNEWDLGFGGGGDVFTDFERQARQMNHYLNRMEKQLSRGAGTNVGSLVDRTFPILPHFVEEDGKKLARFHYDVSGFKPEDVTIKTKDGRLVVSAKHEDKSEDHHSIREFHRMVTVPEGVQLEGMKSRLSPNGLLTIEAPFTAPAITANGHKEIPIKHETKALK